MTETVDSVIRDIVNRGELSDLSIHWSVSSQKWRAGFVMCSKFGASYAEDADPCKAMMLAMTTAKMKPAPRRPPKIDIGHDGYSRMDVTPTVSEDPLADIM
jgi:hypothetical protein